jgi:hypothetical protein
MGLKTEAGGVQVLVHALPACTRNSRAQAAFWITPFIASETSLTMVL